jgi:hypothetical protein
MEEAASLQKSVGIKSRLPGRNLLQGNLNFRPTISGHCPAGRIPRSQDETLSCGVQPQAESALRRAKRRGPVPCGRAAWRVTALVALSDRGLSASRVLKPPRQQIAQQCGAGAKDRKSKNRNTDFQGDGKRPGGGMQRAEYLDQRGRQTDAGAVERRPRHAPRSRVSVRREKRWKHGSSARLRRSYRQRRPASRAVIIVLTAISRKVSR